jgi:hypothetical protein
MKKALRLSIPDEVKLLLWPIVTDFGHTRFQSGIWEIPHGPQGYCDIFSGRRFMPAQTLKKAKWPA